MSRARCADQVVKVGGVTIVGYVNTAGRIAASSSALLARNILAFVDPMIDKETQGVFAEARRRDRGRNAAHRRRRDRASAIRAEAEPTEGVS